MTLAIPVSDTTSTTQHIPDFAKLHSGINCYPRKTKTVSITHNFDNVNASNALSIYLSTYKVNCPVLMSTMSTMIPPQKQELKELAPLDEGSVGDTQPTQYSTIDSAISMTFPDSAKNDLTEFEALKNEPKMHSLKINTHLANHIMNAPTVNTPCISYITVEGMPFNSENIMEMGQVLAQARREKRFPLTITPSYNLKAIIDDYEALQRLNTAREGEMDTKDDAFRPDISRLYIEIQRKIQDRDLAHGEVAADSNVRARLSGFANSTGAETGMYNLMRHAMNSVLRLNNLTVGGDSNIVDAVVTRVVNEIRTTVQSQVARGAHGVDGVNMGGVMEHVFSAIENALGGRVESQADRLDANATRVENVTDLQTTQVKAIATHVKAIDNHVHAMGNNVNAMSCLVNSTNGNVTALSANVITLQTVLSLIPQMITKSIEDMLPDVIGSAIEQAFEAATSNELLNRMQNFVNSVEATRARAEAANNRPSP
ncbi:hypothetical protein E0Z10_g9303 [Xylaria hypoxylon]|uniref:Uncharacterized protein n=1 Tax=Xylaria hypoxylon TaxID=37992 RepID=A0A4Z0YSL2_9PEZI|nr:hypothetical protein E0Z10_g9303 [Xylaria hypoxylon]